MKHTPAILLIILIAFQTHTARAGSCAASCKPGCAAECVCYCRPVARQETVTKECFEVECETICIPGIKFPWQDCCEPPSCGKVRRVRRLTRHEYECGTRIVWEWELSCHVRCIDSIPPGCSRTAGAPGCCGPMN
jgi:hypothetical protein